MSIVAIYRVLYGEDFIKESITSILPHVDKVFVVKAEKPWGNTAGTYYKGEWVSWPVKFDNTRERVMELNEPKVEVIDDYWPTPRGQHTHIVNDLVLERCKPESVVFIEPDHVFEPEEAIKAFSEWSLYSGIEATTRQVEFWKTKNYVIPERPSRTSVIFRKVFGKSIETTEFNGVGSQEIHRLQARVQNLGFCINEKVMYWKHLTAIAFSSIIGDSVPNPEWFEEKWLKWDYETNNENLEISLGYEHMIPRAIKIYEQ